MKIIKHQSLQTFGKKFSAQFFIPLFSLLISSGCSKKFDGKIESRGQDEVYLINTSRYKIFNFTVRVTEITNDSTTDYSIKSITLPPGGEKYLGNETKVSELKYPEITTHVIKVYSKVPDSLKKNEAYEVFFKMKGLPLIKDTIISGTPVEVYYYRDPLKILPYSNLRDTVIAGFVGNYESVTVKEISKMPSPPDITSYKYEVKGQIEIDAKNWKN